MVGLPTQGGDGAFFDSGITALTAAPAALTPVVTTVAATVTTVSATAITAQPLQSSTATTVMVFAITPRGLAIENSSLFALNYRLTDTRTVFEVLTYKDDQGRRPDALRVVVG